MNWLYIKNWDEWQSYRKDRGAPPWIKVHRKLLSNAKWSFLSDAEKGQIVSIWIVAADNDGRVPADEKVLQKICQLDGKPNTTKLIELGFLVTEQCQDDATVTPQCQPLGTHDANLTPTCQPDDAPETETETETEQRQKAANAARARAKVSPPPVSLLEDVTIHDLADLVVEHGLDTEKVKRKLAALKERYGGMPKPQWKNAKRGVRACVVDDVAKLRPDPPPKPPYQQEKNPFFT